MVIMIKTSIRFFDDIPVRAVWNEETSKWWFCAVDIHVGPVIVKENGNWNMKSFMPTSSIRFEKWGG